MVMNGDDLATGARGVHPRGQILIPKFITVRVSDCMDPSSLSQQVGAYEKERLEALAAKPNTTVFTVKHDSVAEPWKVERVRRVLTTIAQRVTKFDDSVDDFVVRKTCMDEDSEVLAFQRQHPKMFWLVTDRQLMRQEKYRNALGGLLSVRDQVEAGRLTDGQEADATATSTVVQALNASK